VKRIAFKSGLSIEILVMWVEIPLGQSPVTTQKNLRMISKQEFKLSTGKPYWLIGCGTTKYSVVYRMNWKTFT
jgi:hypothetical protein